MYVCIYVLLLFPRITLPKQTYLFGHVARTESKKFIRLPNVLTSMNI